MTKSNRLTAYVMDFLVGAGEQGYSVPTDAINRGNERLLRDSQDPGIMSIPYADNLKASKFAVQSYAALVLARQQKAPLGALREIWGASCRCRFWFTAAATWRCAENHG
ncbi:hypothetical protein ACLBOM_12050 [Escherichia coli]